MSALLLDDWVEGRISHVRGAMEMRALYERQKGGWLIKDLQRLGLARPANRPVHATPAPTDSRIPVPDADGRNAVRLGRTGEDSTQEERP